MKIRIRSNVTNIKFDNSWQKRIIEMISNNPQKKFHLLSGTFFISVQTKN